MTDQSNAKPSGDESLPPLPCVCHSGCMAAQRITAPFATPERSADVLGVPKRRANLLIRWAKKSQSIATPAKVNGSNAKGTSRKTGSQ